MPIEQLLPARAKDLGGGFTVRRLLPAFPRQGVGPFVFFDHFGPVATRPEDHHDVRPHPHIGLATVTYLFEGAMLHRDSLGCVQRIEPGAVNWMTAGRGIVHSERRPPDLAATTYTAHGLQLWAALPVAFEEADPTFAHTPADAIPAWSQDGCDVRLLIGDAFGRRSPVATFAPTLYLDVAARAEGALDLPAFDAAFERAVYGVDEPLAIDGADVASRTRWPSSRPARRRPSSRRAAAGTSSSAARRSTGRASSGGTSCRRAANASSARRPTGRVSAWARSPANPSGFRCRRRRCATSASGPPPTRRDVRDRSGSPDPAGGQRPSPCGRP